MADNPELGFSVDTSELEKATKALDDVSEAAGRTEQAADKAGRAGAKMAHDFVPGADAMSGATDKASQAADRYIQQLQKQLDMLGKNKSEQAAIEAQYRGFSAQVQQQAADIGKKIDAWHREEEAAKAAAKAEDMAARQAESAAKSMNGLSFATAGATREFIVIGHEIMTGRFSNIPGSIMVLMERVGGLSTALAGLATPMGAIAGIAVASFGVFAYSVYKGYENVNEFNKAIKLTGGSIGVTREEIDRLAKSIAATGGSTQDARESLLKLAQTGRLSGDALRYVGTMMTDYTRVSGEDAEKVTAKFAKMSDGVAKWAAEHNRSMHFINAEDYARIVRLDEVGNKTEAIRLVSRRYHAQLANEDAKDVSVLVGYYHWLEKGLDSIIEKMRRVASGASKADQFAALDNRIRGIAKGLNDPNQPEYLKKHKREELQELLKQRDDLAASINSEWKANKIKTEDAAASAASIAVQDYINLHADNNTKLSKALDKLKATYYDANGKLKEAMIRVHDNSPEKTIAEYEAARKATMTEFAEKKPKANKVEQWFEREFATLSLGVTKYETQLKAMQSGQAKQAGEHLAAILEMLKFDPTGKKAGTNKEWADKLIAEAKKLDEAQAKVRAAENEKKAGTEFGDYQRKTSLADAQQIEMMREQISLSGQSSLALKMNAAARKIEADAAAEVSREERTLGLEMGELISKYPALYQQIQSVANARKSELLPSIRAEYEYSREWSTGWSEAWAKYTESVTNNAGHAANVFNAMTQGMENSLMNFFETGKGGMRSFTIMMLREFEKIAAAKAAAGIMGAMISGLESANLGQYVGMGEWSPYAKGGAFSGGVQFYANGDVFDKPTAFSHAGGLGVMGEAGPEAVMPLTRGPDGRLGVKAMTPRSNDNGGNQINIEINVQTATGQRNETASGSDTQQASMLGRKIETAVKAVIASELRPGGMLYGR